MELFSNIGAAATEILIPAKTVNFCKWSVVACDQFTSEISYWKDVEAFVDDAPSTLNLILPEAYLGDNEEERLKKIADSANKYLVDGTLTTLPAGFILTDRKTPYNDSRKGIVMAIDLECYSYEEGNKNLCRATEGTVTSRIPPRIKIRANSPIELPHVMLLIDDPDDTVIEKAFENSATENLEVIYDTPLMLGAGRIKGISVPVGTDTFKEIISSLENLLVKDSDGLLYLVGDGNHSLASAKAHWENIRAGLDEESKKTHPARYALVEVVNIHDRGLKFEPIHRVAFGISAEDLIAAAKEFFGCDGSTGNISFVVTDGKNDTEFKIENPPHMLGVGCLGLLLEDIMGKNSGVTVDYIHGEDSVRSLASAEAAGIFLPPISKTTFFETVKKEGVFPRKTFSMGEAIEKRFYMEGKKIVL